MRHYSKSKILLISLIIYGFSSQAQMDSVEYRHFTESFNRADVSIEVNNDAGYSLYYGVKNYLKIIKEGKICDSLKVVLLPDFGNIEYIGDCFYSIMPKTDSSLTLRIKIDSVRNEDIIFPIQLVPVWFIRIPGLNIGGHFETIHAPGRVEAYSNPDQRIKMEFKVTGFEYQIISGDSIIFSGISTDGLFSPESKIVFKKLKKGDKYVLRNIHIWGSDNKERIRKFYQEELMREYSR